MFGFTEGVLPQSLLTAFNLPPNDEGFAIVMRLENGRSLDELLHPPPNVVATHLVLLDLLRIIDQVVYRCLFVIVLLLLLSLLPSSAMVVCVDFIFQSLNPL